MGALQFKVLMLGENPAGWLSLQKQLEKRGCRCWFARSASEALEVNGLQDYDLILSGIPVSQIDSCLSDLSGFQPNVFYCHPVEDGCWWLPVVRHGRKCFGAPGVRGREFMGILDQIIRDRSAEPIVSGEPTTPSTSIERE